MLSLNARDFADRVPRIAALVKAHPGTRVTVEARSGVAESLLRGLGFRLVRRVHRGKPRVQLGGQKCSASDSPLLLVDWAGEAE